MNSVYIDLVASSLGALISFWCVWPTEVLKYHKQRSNESYMTAFKRLYFRGLYKGVGIASLGIVPRNAIPLTLKPYVNAFSDKNVVLFKPIFNGSVLALPTTICSLPQINLSLRKVMFPQESSHKYFIENPKMLYSGFLGYYAKDFLRLCSLYFFYDKTREYLEKTIQTDSRLVSSVISGGTSMFISNYFTNPVDVAITRVQTDYSNKTYNKSVFNALLFDFRKSRVEPTSGYINPKNTLDCIKILYRGVTIRSLRGIPGGMIMFGTCDYVSRTLTSRLE